MNVIQIIKIYITLGVVFLYASSAIAQVITWDGGGNKESWFDSQNWDLNVVPGASHEVHIIEYGDLIVAEGAHVVIKSLLIVESELEILDSMTIDNGAEAVEMIGAIIHNKGPLQLESLLGPAIHIDENSEFENIGVLQITDSGDDGILNFGTINNLKNGLIQIDRSDVFGIDNNEEINNSGVVKFCQSAGLFNKGSLINEPDGQLLFIQTQSLSAPFWNSGTLNNQGLVHIEKAVNGFLQQGSIASTINSGYILIDSIRESGIHMSAGSFTNNNVIQINNCGEHGIEQVNGIFVNSDSLLIDSTQESGIKIGSFSTGAETFHNQALGTILLTNTTRFGANSDNAAIYMQHEAMFTNEGSIEANHLPNGSLTIRGDASFHNINGGNIVMESIFRNGLSLRNNALFSSDAASSSYWQGGINPFFLVATFNSAVLDIQGAYECIP